MWRMITDVEHSQIAGPIHNKCCVKVYVTVAEFIRMDVTVPEWRKPSTLWHTTHVWLHKNSNLHILLVLEASVLPTIKALLYMMSVWLVDLRSRGHAIPVLISDYLHLFGYIKMQSKISICLIIDLQFVRGPYLIWECEMFKKSIITWQLWAYLMLIPLFLLVQYIIMYNLGWVCGIQWPWQASRCTAIILYVPDIKTESDTVG